MIFKFLLLSTILSSQGAQLELTRIDPHGKAQQEVELNEKQKDCLVCHRLERKDGVKKFVTHVTVETCLNCHNKAPHSGVIEHVVHEVTCLSCHSFHRWDQTHFKRKSNLFTQASHDKKLNDYQLKTGSGLMIKKDCQDCHQWK